MGIAAAATLAACGNSSGDAGDRIIVASTSAWGSVAAAVAGPDMTVESIIDKPTDDPHEYQTSPSDAAKLREAALVVYNGGHYDEFAEKAAAGRDKPSINAFELRTGAAKSDDNEHIWYDLNTVAAVAEQIATRLGSIDAEHAQAYTERANAFRAKLSEISAITGRIAAEHPKSPVLQTEPLAHYLLVAAGTDDRTPRAFAEAVEQGTDPAPADVAAVRELLNGKQVRALIYNKQTEDKTTRDVAAAARAAGVPVVEVTETLPENTDYLQWQIGNAQALAKALG
ncbi:zinc ABC transporter substrate-binding protein [Nocardia sp. CDC159]|uniref:Zinc ABC transporter substrate-binding protein n=2 Tax=Nocardiaceae TaxID=85025 RepID=A0A9X2E7C2_9NOCA|nr:MULTISPECIES: zinc ABC transporter substrate-binding protein [Nocardia]MCM6772843.1 zinc ABC transporter substrate-binding protein [Nocardia pulmonis]MCM6785854.1 zinc ABC transporter substrate-binding protein [Nocardia sp. CDC159]